MPDGKLDSAKVKELDVNIREMIAQGATEDDVIAYSADFTKKYSQKKNEAVPSSGAPVGLRRYSTYDWLKDPILNAPKKQGGVAQPAEKPKTNPQAIKNWGQQTRATAESNLQTLGVQPSEQFVDENVAEEAAKQTDRISFDALQKDFNTLFNAPAVGDNTRANIVLPKGVVVPKTAVQQANENIGQIKNVQREKRKDIAIVHGAEVAKQNPELAPIEVGKSVLKIADPDLYKAWERGGFQDRLVARQAEELGIEATAASGRDDGTMELLAQDIDRIDLKYPEIQENIIRHKMAAKAYENAGVGKFTGGIWTVDKMDEIAKELTPEEQAVYQKYIRPEEERLGMAITNMPNWGLAKFGGGFTQIAESSALGVANLVGARSDADIENERLASATDTKYADVGESPYIRNRVTQLQNKKDKSAEEIYELEELKQTENAIGTAGKFVGGASSMTGQVAAFALMARGLGNVLSTPFARAGLLQTGGRAAAGIDGIATTALDFGIKKGAFDTIGMIATGYMASDNDARKQALQMFPDEEDSGKRTAYAETLKWGNALSEMIFNDTKILDLFKSNFNKNVAKFVKGINPSTIGSVEFKAGIKAAAQDAINFAGTAAKNINQEGIEELAPILADVTATAILAPDKLKANDKIEEMWNTYASMAVDGSVVGMLGGLSEYRQSKAQLPFVSNLGRAGFEDFTNAVNLEVDKQEVSGELSPEKAAEKKQIIEAITKQNEIVDKTPVLAKMKGRQREKYVAMAVAEQLKKKQAMQLMTVDPVAARVLNSEVAESEAVREGILTGTNFVTEDGGVIPTTEAAKIEAAKPRRLEGRLARKPKEEAQPVVAEVAPEIPVTEAAQKPPEVVQEVVAAAPSKEDAPANTQKPKTVSETPEEDVFTAKGGNKVVDETGEPITVYHTSKVGNISEFKTSGEIETLAGKVKNEGAYFTPTKGEYAHKGGKEYAVQISIKNPYITTDQIESAIISPEKKAELVSKGHDGVILMRDGKPAEYIVFDKSQIKAPAAAPSKEDAPKAKDAEKNEPIAATPKVNQPTPETETLEERIERKVYKIPNKVSRWGVRGNNFTYSSKKEAASAVEKEYQRDEFARQQQAKKSAQEVNQPTPEKRTAKPTSENVSVSHAGYEGPRRVTGSVKNEIVIEGYGTLPTSSFISKLVEKGRLPASALKDRNVQLSEEYATKLLNDNADLFPVQDWAKPAQPTNQPTPKDKPKAATENKAGVAEAVQSSADSVGGGRSEGSVAVPVNGSAVSMTSKTDKKPINYYWKNDGWYFLDSRGREQKETPAKQEEITKFFGEVSGKKLAQVAPEFEQELASIIEDFPDATLEEIMEEVEDSRTEMIATPELRAETEGRVSAMLSPKETPLQKAIKAMQAKSGEKQVAKTKEELSKVMQDVFGLNEEKAAAAAEIAHLMIVNEAKLNGISVAEQYQRYAFAQAEGAMNEALYQQFAEPSDFDENGKLRPEVAAEIAAERAEIERKAKADGTWMKAPNGKPTNLTEAQYVTVRTKRFKNWFGDWLTYPENSSKVVDSNGEPLVVYHGTNEMFSEFSKDKLGNKTKNPTTNLGFFFSDSEKEARRYAEDFGMQGGSIVPVFLSVKNPYQMPYSEFNKLASGSYNRLIAEKDYDPNKVIKFGDTKAQKEATQKLLSYELDAKNDVAKKKAEIESDGNDGVIIKIGGAREIVSFNSNQAKSATANIGTFSPNTGNILYQAEAEKKISVNGKELTVKPLPEGLAVVNGFYSPIEKRILEFKQPTASATKWKEIVGTKEEAKFTGVAEWLDTKKPNEQVSKADVLAWMRDNRIEVVEVVKGQDSEGGLSDKLTFKKEDVVDKIDDIEFGSDSYFDYEGRTLEYVEEIWEDEEVGYKILQDVNNVYYAFDTRGDEIMPSDYNGGGNGTYFDNFEQAHTAIRQHLYEENRRDNTKFSQYQLEGDKSNYVELYLVLPKEGSMGKVADWRVPSAHSSGDEFVDTRQIVRIRANQRVDAEGNKILFVEEFQGDKGQEGRKVGFKNNDAEKIRNEIKAIEDKLVEKTQIGKHNLYYYIKDNPTDELVIALDKKHDELLKIENRFNDNGVPADPFSIETANWVKLGLKLAVQQAVKKGLSKVVWTTGEQQNDRYDLSNTLESVSVTNLTKGGKSETWVYVLAKNNSDAAYRVDDNGVIVESGKNNLTGNVDGRRLEDVLGKDLTEKIMSKSEAISNFNEVTKPQSIRELANNIFGTEMASSMPLEIMDGGVLAASNHNQVRESIISFLPIDVVNILRSKQLSANDIFNNKNVVFSRLTVNERLAVGKGVVSAIRKTGALLRAELSDFSKTGGERFLLPTLKASNLNAREIAGIVSGSGIFHLNASTFPKEGTSATSIAESFSKRLGRASENEFSPTELANLLNTHNNLIGTGKDTLLRLKYQNPDENIIQGDDFKVTSKGMKGFYGSPTEGTLGIVGKVAESLFKQEVGVTEIVTGAKAIEPTYEVKKDETGYYIVDTERGFESRKSQEKGWDTKEEAEKWAESAYGSEEEITEQYSIDITPDIIAEVTQGMPLFQNKGLGAQGAIVMQAANRVVYAMTNPNVTTPLHELSHGYFDTLISAAENGNAQAAADVKVFAEQAGVKAADLRTDEAAYTKAQELFARGFERYLRDGKAPTPELQSLFDKFKNWLLEIYKSLAESPIDVPLNDAMRAVYGRMLTPEQVKQDFPPKPPVSNPVTQEEKDDITGIKHADTEKDRIEAGLPPYDKTTKSDDDLEAEANELIQKGWNFEKNIDKVLNDGKILSDAEQVALGKYKIYLRDIANASPTNANINAYERVLKALEFSGTIAGRALRARQLPINPEPTLADFLVRQKEESGVDELTPAQFEQNKKEFEALQKASQEWEAKFKALEAEAIAKAAEENLSSKKKNKPKTPRTKENIRKERDEILQRIKDRIKKAKEGKTVEIDGEQVNVQEANVVPYLKQLMAIAPEIPALVSNYIEEGVLELSEIAKRLKKDLEDEIPDITEEDAIALIAGEYKTANKKTRNEIQKTLFELRAEAKAIKQLEDLENGVVPTSETKKVERNRKIAELRKKIKEHPNNQLPEYKKQVKRSIDKLQRDLDSGNFAAPPKKLTVTLDKEARELKRKLVDLKTEREVRLLREAYEKMGIGQKVGEKLLKVANIPRTLMASMDFSAPFRQAIIATIGNPTLAFKAFGSMFKAAFNKGYMDEWFFDLENDPNYEIMKESGLSIADPNSPFLRAREEAFMSGYVEKVEGFIGEKLFGSKNFGFVQGSERAYVMYLNKMRVDLFNKYAAALEEKGKTYDNSPETYKGIAKYVNNVTGRGNMGKAEEAAKYLNAIFFSPRLIASRLSLLNPVYFAKMPMDIKKIYLKDMAAFISTGLTVIGMIYLAGGGDEEDDIWVEIDPRSSDFMKIRQGEKRWDIWGGFQQYIRTFVQFAMGEKKSPTTDEITELKEDAPYGETRGKLLTRFVRNKLAPVPSSIIDLTSGRSSVGEKTSLKDELLSSITPLLWQQVYEVAKAEGAVAAITIGVPSVFGVGTERYGERAIEAPDKIKVGAKEYKLSKEMQEKLQVMIEDKTKKVTDEAKKMAEYTSGNKKQKVEVISMAKLAARNKATEDFKAKYEKEYPKETPIEKRARLDEEAKKKDLNKSVKKLMK